MLSGNRARIFYNVLYYVKKEAFFGREIMDRSKDMPFQGLKAVDSDDDHSRSETPKLQEVKEESKIAINSEQIRRQISEKQKQAAEAAASQAARRAQTPVQEATAEEPDLELDDLGLDIEEDFLKMFGKKSFHLNVCNQSKRSISIKKKKSILLLCMTHCSMWRIGK